MSNRSIEHDLGAVWSKMAGIRLALRAHEGNETFAVKIKDLEDHPDVIRVRAHMVNALNFIDSTAYAFEKAFSRAAYYKYTEIEPLMVEPEKRTTPYVVAESIRKLGSIRDDLILVTVDRDVEPYLQSAVKELSDRLECARANLLIADKIMASDSLVKLWKAE